MGLGDITGIFSRFFVVGFYLPSFFVLVAFDRLFSPELNGNRIYVIGGAALFLALLLLGLRDFIWFKFSGYWLETKHRIGLPRDPAKARKSWPRPFRPFQTRSVRLREALERSR